MKTYADKLRDPRWQKKRLQLLEKAGWSCQTCRDSKNTLEVHHKYYAPKKDPWDYQDFAYKVLCRRCHEIEQEEMLSAHASIAKYDISSSVSAIFQMGQFAALYIADAIWRLSLMPPSKRSKALVGIKNLIYKVESE
jgi:hypothetical protein